MSQIVAPTPEVLQNPRVRPITRLDEGVVAYLVRSFSGSMDLDTFRGVFQEIKAATDVVIDGLFRNGFETAPLFRLAIRERATVYADKPTLDMMYRRIYAATRDITELLYAHVAYRRAKSGNFVAEWRGPTGMTKSSCMMGFVETTSAMAGVSLHEKIEADPKLIEHHVAYDVTDLPTKLPLLKFGEGIMLDEEVRTVGEGSVTARELLSNIEDMIRQTGIDIHFASPSGGEHETSQAVLEAVAVDWEHHRTRFMVSIAYGTPEPMPLGMVTLPWCSPATYEAYKPLKKAILERTLRMMFHPGAATEDTVKEFFEDARTKELLAIFGQPPKNNWRPWVQRFSRSMSIAELNRVSSDVGEMFTILTRATVTSFEKIYGWAPSRSMMEAANRLKKQQGRARQEESNDDDL